MKYQLVLWDFDGTLADTLPLALSIYNRMAAERNFKPIDDPHAVRDMGMREFLKSHGVPLHKIPFAFSTFLGELRTMAADVVLYDGIDLALQQISEHGILQGIVSSNNTETIRQCLKANNAEAHFDYVSGTSRIFGKEKRIKQALAALNVPAKNALYIGDEIRDIEAARSAGLDIVAVAWGLNSAAALTQHRPTHLILTPSELLAILEG
jgi:phosphoglycolate phosphatase